jgi:hydrogenase maturation protease
VSTLVIAIGSPLRGDDGIGAAVIEALKSEKLPPGTTLMERNVTGMDLLAQLMDHDRAVIIDAADMGFPSGTVRVFTMKDIVSQTFNELPTSHAFNLIQTLQMAERLELKTKITVVGIQHAEISFTPSLSQPVTASIPIAVEKIRKILAK